MTKDIKKTLAYINGRLMGSVNANPHDMCLYEPHSPDYFIWFRGYVDGKAANGHE